MELELNLQKYGYLLPYSKKNKFCIIGAGGTGGYVIRDLSRIIASNNETNHRRDEMIVIDGDNVESHNISRQNFIAKDVHKSKAEVLATRYSRAFQVGVSYNPIYFDENVFLNMVKNEIYESTTSSDKSDYSDFILMSVGDILNSYSLAIDKASRMVMVSCVDNRDTRNILSDILYFFRYSYLFTEIYQSVSKNRIEDSNTLDELGEEMSNNDLFSSLASEALFNEIKDLFISHSIPLKYMLEFKGTIPPTFCRNMIYIDAGNEVSDGQAIMTPASILYPEKNHKYFDNLYSDYDILGHFINHYEDEYMKPDFLLNSKSFLPKTSTTLFNFQNDGEHPLNASCDILTASFPQNITANITAANLIINYCNSIIYSDVVYDKIKNFVIDNTSFLERSRVSILNGSSNFSVRVTTPEQEDKNFIINLEENTKSLIKRLSMYKLLDEHGLRFSYQGVYFDSFSNNFKSDHIKNSFYEEELIKSSKVLSSKALFDGEIYSRDYLNTINDDIDLAYSLSKTLFDKFYDKLLINHTMLHYRNNFVHVGTHRRTIEFKSYSENVLNAIKEGLEDIYEMIGLDSFTVIDIPEENPSNDSNLGLSLEPVDSTVVDSIAVDTPADAVNITDEELIPF